MKLPFQIGIILKKIFIKIFYLLMAAVFLGVFIPGYLYFIAPQQKGIAEGENVNLKEKQQQLIELEDYVSKLEAMSQNYDNYSQKRIGVLMSILPREKDIPGLYVQMQELAKKNNFALNSISITEISPPSEAVSQKAENNGGGIDELEKKSSANAAEIDNSAAFLPAGIRGLNIAFSISGGNYENLKSFLSDIEKNLRLFDINDINFGSVQEGPYSINMRTYYISQ